MYPGRHELTSLDSGYASGAKRVRTRTMDNPQLGASIRKAQKFAMIAV